MKKLKLTILMPLVMLVTLIFFGTFTYAENETTDITDSPKITIMQDQENESDDDVADPADQNGWQSTPEGIRYLENGSPLLGQQLIEGKYYLFDNNGFLQTGWQLLDGKEYYFNPTDGARLSGLQTIGSTTYLLTDDGKAKGWHVLNGVVYYFDPISGGRLTGFRKIGNSYYLLTASGKKTGWHVLNNKVYYFDLSSGALLTGMQKIGNTTYLLTVNGRLSGWHVVNGKIYYFNETNGGLLTGIRKIGGTTYLLSYKGRQTGWHVVNGKAYYFSPENGGMLTGLRKIGNTYYYLTAGQGKLYGQHVINGKVYYFNHNGAAIRGWFRNGNNDYFYNNNPDESPYQLRNTSKVINSRLYTFDPNGICVNSGYNNWVYTDGYYHRLKNGIVVDSRYVGADHIVISIPNQTLWLYRNGKLAKTVPVVTGKNSTPTPPGHYNIILKQRKTTLVGPGYASFVEYWMLFRNGGYGLHDANWRTANEFVFNGTLYKNSGSHGCININPQEMPEIYGLTYVGMPVTVFN